MSQKAAVYLKKHEYPVIQERPIPNAKDDKILLKINAVGLNPVDWKMIEYGFAPEPPAILGYDVAGVVEDVGPDVKNYQKGDRITSWTTRASLDEGGFQQFALVSSAPNLTSKIPANVTEDEASTLPVALNTALVALYTSSGFGFPNPFDGGEPFGKGKAILVIGGSSIIALSAIQLLRLSGFSTIITTAAKKHEPLVTKFGVTHFIDRSLPEESQIEQIHKIAPTLQYAWDPISSKGTGAFAARSFGPQGGLIIGSLPADAAVLAQYKKVTARNISSNPIQNQEAATKVWSHLEEALENGDIKPFPYQVGGGLANITEALEAVKKASGYKVIVHPQE